MEPRAKQKRNGKWFIEFESIDGRRRRLTTGIKTPPSIVPPREVKIRMREILLSEDPIVFRLYPRLGSLPRAPEVPRAESQPADVAADPIHRIRDIQSRMNRLLGLDLPLAEPRSSHQDSEAVHRDANEDDEVWAVDISMTVRVSKLEKP